MNLQLQISTLEFDGSGQYLAVGYTNGSIAIMFRNKRGNSSSSTTVLSASSLAGNVTPISLSSSTSSGSLKRHEISGSNESMNKKRILKRRSNTSDNIMMIDDNHYDNDFDSSGGGGSGQSYEEPEDMFIMDQDNYDNISVSSSSVISLANDIDMLEDQIQQQIHHHQQRHQQSSFEILFHFQAHESEVIQIRWCKGVCSHLLFLSTSVSSSKLWRFIHNSSSNNINDMSIHQLPLRIINNHNNPYRFSLKKSFEHEEIFNLNSLSINSDGQTFLSSDEFRVYLWDLNIGQQCYNIIDLKPANMQHLTEIIRVTEFHPLQCNSLIYGSSSGTVKLVDMRISALCNSHSKIYESKQNNQSIFSQYLNSILDLKFNNDGRYFVTRNLESLLIWDINVENKPLATYNLYNQEYLLAKLYNMYDSSSFVEKFPCTFINNNEIITGSYDNKSLVWNPFTSDSFSFESTAYQFPMQTFEELQLHENSPPMFGFPQSSANNIVNQFGSSPGLGNQFSIQSPPLLSLDQQQSWFKQFQQQQHNQQQQPSPPLPPVSSATSAYLFDPIQIDVYNQFNHIPVRSWSSVSKNNSITSSLNVNSNQSNTTTTTSPTTFLSSKSTTNQHSSSSSMSVDKLTIKDHLNSMINCISHSNGSIALSNKNQLFIYSSS